jgi:pimeloyl-ACP methyl ester carboxylesterase
MVRLRTIETTPTVPGPFPTVVFVQGHGYQSVDTALLGESPLRDLVRSLGRRGIAVVRSERRGVGDAEGGPPEAVPFATELGDHGAVLDHARALPTVDPRRVVLFGHSLGGNMALALAAERPWVAGVAVYGAGVRTWPEYLDQNARRHLQLAGTDPVELERLVRLQQRLSARVLVLGESLARCLAEEPELAREGWRFGIDARGLWHGHPDTWWQAVHALPTVAHAVALRCPVLALWGTLDHLSARDEHEALAALTGGRFQAIPGADHQLQRQPDARGALENRPGPFAAAVAEQLAAWVLGLGAR